VQAAQGREHTILKGLVQLDPLIGFQAVDESAGRFVEIDFAVRKHQPGRRRLANGVPVRLGGDKRRRHWRRLDAHWGNVGGRLGRSRKMVLHGAQPLSAKGKIPDTFVELSLQEAEKLNAGGNDFLGQALSAEGSQVVQKNPELAADAAAEEIK